jgi:hypothetical protein
MVSLRYWMIFQAIVGVWLVISPFVLGSKEMMPISINNIIVGRHRGDSGAWGCVRQPPGPQAARKKSQPKKLPTVLHLQDGGRCQSDIGPEFKIFPFQWMKILLERGEGEVWRFFGSVMI